MRWAVKTWLVCLALGLLSAACDGGKTKKKQGAAQPSVADLPEEFDGPFDPAGLSFDGKTATDAETLWALAQCHCAPGRIGASLQQIADKKGVLPQILMPQVREQIKSNTALQALQKIPLGGLLADFFASDEKLNQKVREGLAEKLKRSPGGSNLAERVPFRFDGFPALGQNASADTFVLSDQIARWSAVFSADGLWSDRDKIDGTDHGLQVLELLRTLSEWSYLVGMDKNSDGGNYGGLTLTIDDNRLKRNGPIDPAASKTGWFLSGSYKLTFDDKSARDLATSVKEQWQHLGEPVQLDEQARLWMVMAEAFERLRPEQRGAFNSLFGSEADRILPDNVHELPLAFLSGMKVLLPGPFIDKDARGIFAEARIGTADGSAASLLGTARLMGALSRWSEELKSLGSDTVSPETAKKVASAPEEFLPALQLSVQNILNAHTIPAASVGGRFGLALHEENEPASVATASEVLVLLMDTEEKVLASEFLRERILQMLDWYAGDLIAGKADYTSKELLWMRTLAARASLYAPDRTEHWAKELVEHVDHEMGI